IRRPPARGLLVSGTPVSRIKHSRARPFRAHYRIECLTIAGAAMAGQILAGIRVLELGQLIAGPFAAKTLADFGAQVVKIEPDRIRRPPASGLRVSGTPVPRIKHSRARPFRAHYRIECLTIAGAAMAGQILAGIRVLELGQLIAGPFAAKTLADFGAQVVKIE